MSPKKINFPALAFATGLACGQALAIFSTSAVASPLSTAPLPAPRGIPAIPDRGVSEMEQLARWVRSTGDNQRLPFLIVDKKQARVWVFEPSGALRGSTPALMGAARGDHSVPGIGERPMASIRPEERTTPAGRFAAELGHNIKGEDIVWVDYDAAVSLHRVRATNPAERRLQRLASPTPQDNRISYGCINVPQAFYESIVLPALKEPKRAVVYVLPETSRLSTVFGGIKAASYLP